jgi:antitoxin (DNA-binding transcriptional repressor) of toxin-antitoxin stability system
MKRYTAAEARARLSDALDHAEAGAAVVIERRGVRFRLVRDSRRAHRATPASSIEIIDPAVEQGQWTWTITKGQWRFVARRPVRRVRASSKAGHPQG